MGKVSMTSFVFIQGLTMYISSQHAPHMWHENDMEEQGWDVAQLVERLPSMQKALGSIPRTASAGYGGPCL